MILRLMMQTAGLALGQIWVNKFRACLTALGIIIGVSSILVVVALLGGMRQGILDEFESVGAKKVWIWGQVPRSLRGQLSWDSVKMTLEEVEALRDHCPSIELITPMVGNAYEVRAGEESIASASVQGVGADYLAIEDRDIVQGRALSAVDFAEGRPVCLINEKAIEELDLPEDPTGQSIQINRRRFLVAGVIKDRAQSMFSGNDSNAEFLIPVGHAVKMNQWSWVWCMASLDSPEKVEEARQEIRFVLRKSRRLAPDYPDTFEMQIMQQAIDQFNSMAAGITMVAGGVVSIALLVGGIGIMNIMLVSVSERTREIGLRKAVGARPGVVLTQFLTEAVTLCVVGGAIGVVIGQAAVLIARSSGESLAGAKIPVWAIILALGFSAGVGIVFGMFPAVKAARLDPIEALRHE
jgi:putative ABC transport system permease protein